jgi:MYXO-CTERM domain-containing protein
LLGRVPGDTSLRISIALPLRNQPALDGLLRDLADPHSPLFRHFLTVEQFTARFGPTEADDQKVAKFAESFGLTVRSTSPNRTVLDVSGAVRDIERAFAFEMGTYQHPTENRTFFAPNVEPSVASDLPILSVVGLSDRVRPWPLSARREAAPGATPLAGTGPGGAYLGSDMRSAYAPGVTLDGTGQSVGLFELAPYNILDIYNYFSTIGQPMAVPIVNVLLDGVDGLVPDGGDDGEEALDIQQIISMAPNLSSLIVYQSQGYGGTELDVWNRMATDNVAKQLSSSWAYSFPELGDQQVFQEFVAQGQNLFQASGDNGAYSTGMPMIQPTDNPNLITVGGTHLTLGSDGGWQSEVAWGPSGGGVSTNRVALPAYQAGVASAANQGSAKYRNIPDVCAEADFDNLVCSNGGCYSGWGGTSFAAPRWAGFFALVNQQTDGTTVGFLNPILYPLAEGPSYGSLLHDVTQGNDFNKQSPDLFSAVVGYDLVTGWGSPTGQSLIDALAPVPSGPNFALAAAPAFGALEAGKDLTFTIALTPSGGFSETVDLTASIVGTVRERSAVLSASSLAGSGSVVLTVSATSDVALQNAAGTFQVVVTGTSGMLSHSVYVTVGPASFFLRVPPEVFVDQSSSGSISVAVNPVNGFQGEVEIDFDAGLPDGVSAELSASEADSSGSPVQLGFAATADAGTGLFLVRLSGLGGGVTAASQTVVAVSAASDDGGSGLPVDLTASFNKLHIATDGIPFSEDRMVNNDFYAYSGNLLKPQRNLAGVRFVLGPPDQLDSVAAIGQSVALPQGSFTDLWLLAAAINGAQHHQNLILAYTDRTGVVLTQSFSDWDYPESFRGEIEAVAMRYRALGNGGMDANNIQNLYAYHFALDATKTLQSLTLPGNPNVIVHAITLLGPGASIDAGPVSDGGKATARSSGCGCSGVRGDASSWGEGTLGLALLLATRRRRHLP